MAPRKAKTGMVCPTSWLYRPGIIPREAKRFGRQQSPREPRCLCGANAIEQKDLPLTLFKAQAAINQITLQTGRLTAADRLVKIRWDAKVTEKHQHFHLDLYGHMKA